MTGNDEPSEGAATTAPADPFRSFASLKAAHSELLEREPETEKDPAYLAGIESFFARARATGELLSDEEERRSAQSILNYWVTVLYRAERKPKHTALAELKSSRRPNLADAPCPYPGLRPFNESERRYFYGRPRQTDYLSARLKIESLLVLLGPSGSGKTSLVQAGLIPELRKLELDEEAGNPKRYFLPFITPGSNPLQNLADMLDETGLDAETDSAKHYERLKRSPDHLRKFVEAHLTMPVVIFVDQFEEIFTLCRDKQIREAFVNNLMRLNDSDHKIILCMRDDDFSREIKKLPELKRSFERGSATLPKLGSIELSDAITKPAEIVGWKLEDSTVKEIVQEIINEPVGLPLLQFTLLSLWEKRTDAESPEKFFKRMGGCRAILTSRADSLFQQLSPQHKEVARKILARLTRIDFSLRPHSRIALREDLYREIKSPQTSSVLDALVKANLARLLESARPSDTQVELAHESLFFNWPVTISLVEQQRRTRYRLAVAVALLIIAIGALGLLGVYLTYTNYEAKVAEGQKIFVRSVATKWAAGSGKELTDKHLDLAFLLGLAAFDVEEGLDKTTISVQTRGALLNLLNFNPRPKALMRRKDKLMVGAISLNHDGTLLAANDSDGTIVFWDVNRRQAQGGPLQDSSSAVPAVAPAAGRVPFSPLAFSRDGQILATGSFGAAGSQRFSNVSLWDVSSHKLLKTLRIEGDDLRRALRIEGDDFSSRGHVLSDEEVRILNIAFSPDGKKLAAGYRDGAVLLWDIGEARILQTLHTKITTDSPVKPAINVLQFSPDSKMLAAGRKDGNAILWDINGGRDGHVLKQYCECLEQQITSLVFDATGSNLIIGSTEDIVIWDVRSAKAQTRLISEQNGAGMFVSLSPDSKTLQAIDSRGGLYLWDMETGKRIGKNLLKEVAAPWSISFSGDGRMLATSGEDGLTVWDIAGQRPLLGHLDYVETLAFSPDSSTLASSGDDGKVILWNAASRTPTRELTSDHKQAVMSMAYSHDGRLLAAGLLNGSALLWDVNNAEGAGMFLEARGDLTEQPQRSVIAFSQDDKEVALVSTYPGQQESVYLSTWNTSQPVPSVSSRLPLGESDAIASIAFSPDGKMLIIGTNGREAQANLTRERKGGAVILWDIAKHEQRSVLKDFDGEVSSLGLSADAGWAAIGTNNNQILLWETRKDGERITLPLEGHPGEISHIAFSPDNKTLAATISPRRYGDSAGDLPSEPEMILLWDIESGKQLGNALVGHDGVINALTFSHDGKMLASGGADNSVLIWNMDIQAAKEIICGIVNRDFTQEEITQYGSGLEAEKRSKTKLSLSLSEQAAAPRLTNPCR